MNRNSSLSACQPSLSLSLSLSQSWGSTGIRRAFHCLSSSYCHGQCSLTPGQGKPIGSWPPVMHQMPTRVIDCESRNWRKDASFGCVQPCTDVPAPCINSLIVVFVCNICMCVNDIVYVYMLHDTAMCKIIDHLSHSTHTEFCGHLFCIK